MLLVAIDAKAIMHHVRRNFLDEAEKGQIVLTVELAQRPAIVGKQFEVSIVDQVVNQFRSWTGPVPDAFRNYAGNHRLKPSDKLRPCGSVIRFETAL